MGKNITFELPKGNLKDLLKSYAVMGDEAKKEVRTGLEKGAEIIAEHARKHHRFESKTTRLEANIKAELNPDKSKLSATVFIDDSQVPYGKYIHKGYAPFDIKVKKAKALYWGAFSGGKPIFAKKVRHSGWKKDPFLFEASKAKSEDVFKRINQGIEKAIKKAGF